MSEYQKTKNELQMVSILRRASGYPICDCKIALEKSEWNVQKALEYLRNLKVDKKYSAPVPITQTSTVAGRIHSYIHHNGKIGVLLEVQCATDFTARTDEFKILCDNVCMQIAATNPQNISPDQYRQLNQYAISTQKEFLKNKMLSQKKPENIIDQIVDNMISKKINEQCLTTQQFIMNEKITISELIAELQKTTKENITIVKFVRFELGK